MTVVWFLLTNPYPGATEGGGASTSGAQRLELQAARWLEETLPFLLLLVLVFLREQLVGLLTFVWLSVVMLRCNADIRKQVALRENRQVQTLVSTAAVLCSHVAFVYGTQDSELFNSLFRGLIL